MHAISATIGIRYSLMKQFIDELQSNGITANTVDVSSKKGDSKWKIYYRSANYPKYGVLLSHEDSEHALTFLRQKLDTELANYKTLSSVGYDVPDTCEKSIEIEDHLDGSKKSAAIIVEHIEGRGPYKAKTGIISLRRYVSSKPDLKEAYEGSFAGGGEILR